MLFYVLLVTTIMCNYCNSLYWHQWADERFGDPPPRWIQEPSVVRDRDERPQEDPLAVYCFCVCLAGVHCWKISLG